MSIPTKLAIQNYTLTPPAICFFTPTATLFIFWHKWSFILLLQFFYIPITCVRKTSLKLAWKLRTILQQIQPQYFLRHIPKFLLLVCQKISYWDSIENLWYVFTNMPWVFTFKVSFYDVIAKKANFFLYEMGYLLCILNWFERSISLTPSKASLIFKAN